MNIYLYIYILCTGYKRVKRNSSESASACERLFVHYILYTAFFSPEKHVLSQREQRWRLGISHTGALMFFLYFTRRENSRTANYIYLNTHSTQTAVPSLKVLTPQGDVCPRAPFTPPGYTTYAFFFSSFYTSVICIDIYIHNNALCAERRGAHERLVALPSWTSLYCDDRSREELGKKNNEGYYCACAELEVEVGKCDMATRPDAELHTEYLLYCCIIRGREFGR